MSLDRLFAVASQVLLAAVRRRPQAGQNPSGFFYYLAAFLLVVAIVIGVPLAHRLWKETREEEDDVHDEDMLSQLRNAYEAGQMDEAEFRRVSELLGERGAAAASAAPRTDATAPPAAATNPARNVSETPDAELGS